MTQEGEVTRVPVSGAGAHVGATAYLAVLAYPSPAEWSKRDEFIAAAMAWFAKQYIACGGERKRIKERYRAMKNEKMDGVLDRAFYRVAAWRLPAAMMARWMMIHGQRVGRLRFVAADPARPGWAPTGSTACAERIAELLDAWPRRPRRYKDAECVETHNVLARCWSSSLPVLHLSIALYHHLCERVDLRGSVDPLLLIRRPEWIPAALAQAEMLRLYLRDRVTSFDPARAVQLLS